MRRSVQNDRREGDGALTALSRLRLRHPGTPRTPRFYGLHVSIAVLFSVLIALLGVALIAYNFHRHRALALDAAAELFAEVARNAAGAAESLYAPVEALVEQTARLNAGTGAAVDELPLSIGYFAESLASHPQLDAMYLGFANGDFFLVRQVGDDAEARTALSAPDATAYVVQRIERDRFDEPVYVTSYHDEALEPLALSRDFVTGFDPRSRPWYRDANASDGTVVTDFYRFFTSGKIGTTLARRMQDGGAVIGADLALETISRRLQSPALPDATRVVLFTADGEIVGYDDAAWLERRTEAAVRGRLRSPQISDIGHPEIAALFDRFVDGERDGRMTIDAGRGAWFGSVSPIDFGAHDESGVYAAILVPERSLLAGQRAVRLQGAFLSLVGLGLAIALAWWLAASISRSTRELARDALAIGRLELDHPIAARSRIREIDRLAGAMDTTRSAIRRFVALTRSTGAEHDVERLAALALEHIGLACDASRATVLLVSDDGRRLVRVAETLATDPATGVPFASDYTSDVIDLPPAAERARRSRPDQAAALSGRSVLVETHHGDAGYELAGYRSGTVLAVPLRTESGGVVGVVQLGDPGRPLAVRTRGNDIDTVAFVEALATHAALAFENQRLAEARRDSFEALIRMLAKAIDAKSPHTGKHCQRVPLLCSLLAEAASESDLPPFRDFVLNDESRLELDVATWLHDCGKVTTPEHVLDKAVRLETVHNRIHEIRTRFEVLWRDAELDYLYTLAGDPHADEGKARRARDETHAHLREDFAFIAECNAGSRPMGPEQVRRVREIGARTWLRHFDDTLGLSPGERERHVPDPSGTLPAVEPLIADKPIHRVAREDGGRPWGDNPFGFDMYVPPYAFDAGEVHNLIIPRGTLTPEERFRIEDHVVKTIEMLDAIPFPRELARVPRIAGSHHERLDGSGYPRGRVAEDLSIEDRILAIADVFEALTAPDRPYRAPMTLEGSIAIMRGMCDGGELCSELFELFIERKLHVAYAERLREGAGANGTRARRTDAAHRGELIHGTD